MESLLLRASVQDGVNIVDIADYSEADIIRPRTFIDSLRHLSDDEEIFTQIGPAGTDGLFEEIDDEYGIR